MVTDNRMVTKNAAGKEFDLSNADSFDYTSFFVDMTGSERLQLSKDEVRWMQRHAAADRRADVVLNLSCGVQTIPHLMLTQVALFEALGVDFVATAGPQYCCGRVFQRFGKNDRGDRMAARSIDRFASWQAATNVQCCGSCFIEFDYHVAKMKEDGAAPFEVVHIIEFLLDRLRQLGDKVRWRQSIPRRVLLHAEGAEVHPSKAKQRDMVIETLKLIPGVEFVGLADNPSLGSPCATKGPGEPSILNDVTPEEYRQIQAELEEQARRAGADAIVTHHHMCQREWCKFGSDRLPVIHYQSMFLAALGTQVPDRFQTLWQLGDPELVLERTRPHWQSWGIAEADARVLVQKFFVPKYASAVQRCPCEGNCFEAVAGARGGTSCAPSMPWNTSVTRSHDASLDAPGENRRQAARRPGFYAVGAGLCVGSLRAAGRWPITPPSARRRHSLLECRGHSRRIPSRCRSRRNRPVRWRNARGFGHR
jgi:cysteine-rich protein